MRLPAAALQLSPLLCARPAPPRARTPLLVRDDVDASLCPGVDKATFRCGTVEAGDMPACVAVLMDGFYKTS